MWCKSLYIYLNRRDYKDLGAFFSLQLEKVELLNIIPLVPPISPRLGDIQNISMRITPEIANGEIGFISNLPIILHEPEDSVTTVVSKYFFILSLLHIYL